MDGTKSPTERTQRRRKLRRAKRRKNAPCNCPRHGERSEQQGFHDIRLQNEAPLCDGDNEHQNRSPVELNADNDGYSSDSSSFNSCDSSVQRHFYGQGVEHCGVDEQCDNPQGNENGDGDRRCNENAGEAGAEDGGWVDSDGNSSDSDDDNGDSEDNSDSETDNDEDRVNENLDIEAADNVCGDVEVDDQDSDVSVESNGPEDEGEDPDDPDPGSSESSESSESDDSSSDSENEDNFSFNNPRMNSVIHLHHNLTVREVMALLVSIAVKENWTFISFLRVTTAFNIIFGRKYLPENKHQLWKYLDRKFFGVKKKLYCMKCHGPLDRRRHLEGELLRCPNGGCGAIVREKKAKFYYKLSLQRQFKHILSFPNSREMVSYRHTRQKKVENGLEDIIDGQKCKDMEQPGNPLHFENNFTMQMNTDAFKLSKSKTRVWPIFVKLDALPPNIRQKHMFLAAVFADNHDPIMSDYFDPVVTECNRLIRTGVTWTPPGEAEVQSRFFISCFVMDAIARCEVLSMNPPTGYFGCTFCLHPGIYHEGAVRYPYTVPAHDLRTDQGMKHDMEVATEEDRILNGVQGASALMNLQHFDLGSDIPVDDLHPLFLGAMKTHVDLLFSEQIINAQSLRVINGRMKRIRTPTFIARKPRALSRRQKFTGTEWRNLALYYMVPCFRDVVPNAHLNLLQHFAKGVYLCSKEGVTEAELEIAEDCFRNYVRLFGETFGLGRMKFTIHVLLHAVACVRRFGPLYAQSTFGFESWNHRLMLTVKSGKGVCDQIVTRFLMRKFAETNSVATSDTGLCKKRG